MKKIIFLSVFINYIQFLYSQKPAIDVSDFDKFQRLSGAQISNKGDYIYTSVFDPKKNKYESTLHSTTDSWNKKFSGISDAQFSQDSKYFLFKSGEDSLVILNLKTKKMHSVCPIKSYQLSKNGNGEYVAYRSKFNKSDIGLRNLETKEERRFENVKSFMYNDKGTILILQKEEKKENAVLNKLVWIDLLNFNDKVIWEGAALKFLTFDDSGTQLAFIASEITDTISQNLVCYYKQNLDKAFILIRQNTAGIDSGFLIANSSILFSRDGNRIFFKIIASNIVYPALNSVKVDVWSYKDKRLQTEQLSSLGPKSYAAIYNLKDKRVIRIQNENEEMPVGASINNGNDFVVLYNNKDLGEWWWPHNIKCPLYIVSTKDGSRRILKENINYLTGYIFEFSPSKSGQFLIYFDPEQKHYFSYNLITGVTINITKGFPVSVVNEDFQDRPGLGSSVPVGLAAWLQGDESLLVYDNYDIWMINLTRVQSPVNITNGYGRKNKIKFRLLMDRALKDSVLTLRRSIVLSAFNKLTKHNGFYRCALGKKENPELLMMGPYNICHLKSQSPPNTFSEYNFFLLKAKESDIWVVRRMSPIEAPNYFLTRNFKNFNQLTNVNPQEEYNWLTAEVLQWKMLDGKMSHGILYKPEDFNPNKKYPIILNYYEKRSDEVYDYLYPKLSRGNLDITYFVSNGYIIFVPDVYYNVGEGVGEGCYNSVISAAQFLSKMIWVDSSRMAIQGHSHGGTQTNYLVTHTKMFAAAASAAGTVNLISAYGGLVGFQGSRQFIYETYQGRIGATLWDRPDLYIKYSPIFNADKVSIPLLMMHNRIDAAVPGDQAIEFFTALRRLQKKSWLLQYDDEGHILISDKNAFDYTLRLKQFFDHYLKDAPAPIWMTQGIPARLKGVETGYKLDTAGCCNNDCMICKMWNNRFYKNSNTLKILK